MKTFHCIRLQIVDFLWVYVYKQGQAVIGSPKGRLGDQALLTAKNLKKKILTPQGPKILS